MVYAEALAAGTPVVASTNTPWQEVEKFNCGKCVENTSDKFTDAINEILSSDPEQIGKNGSNYIGENFSWEELALRFMDMSKRISNAK